MLKELKGLRALGVGGFWNRRVVGHPPCSCFGFASAFWV